MVARSDAASTAQVVADAVDLTAQELDERIRALELERRRVEAELALTIAVADARGLHEDDGHRTMRGYLAATCNWSASEIARFRDAATTADRHPEVGDAWLGGHIGVAQVTALGKVRRRRETRERFAEFVPTLVEHAERLPLHDFQIVLDRIVQLAAPDPELDEREAVERRSVTATDVGGELFLRGGGGDALTTAEFLAILRRFEQAEFEKDLAARDAALSAGDEPRPFRTGAQRRFDALVAITRAAADHTGIVTPSQPLVTVLVDDHTMGRVLARSGLGATESLDGAPIDPFTGLPGDPDALDDLLGEPGDLLGRRCETADGVSLRPSDVLRSLLSGHVRRAVLGADRRVIDLGRSSRVFTGAARDAALLLSTSCEHPGCDLPAEWCQVDHATEWHELGGTDQDNAGTRCRHHNLDKHRRRRRTRRATDGRTYTIRDDGTIMLPVGCRPPRFEPDEDLDDCPDHRVPPGGDDRQHADRSIDATIPDDERWLADVARARVAALVSS